jgi:uncharacterized delta-60 repeat protein
MKSTAKFCTLVLILCSLVLSSISCDEQSGTGVSSGCSGVNSATTSMDTGEVLIEGSLQGPVDLPVTIAKAIPSIDADSIVWSPATLTNSVSSYATSSASSSTTADKSAQYATIETAGTLYWNTEDGSCGNTAVLADGNVLDIVTSDPISCQFARVFTNVEADIEIGLVNMGDAVLTNNVIVGNVSYPVGLIIYSPDDNSPLYSIVVVAALIGDGSAATELNATVTNGVIGYLDDTVIFPATDSDGLPTILSLPFTGAIPTVVEDLNNAAMKLINVLDETDTVYVKDSADNVFPISASGAGTILTLDNMLTGAGSGFLPHPNGSHAIYTAEVTNPATGNITKTLGLFDIGLNVDEGVMIFDGQISDFTGIQYTWMNSSILAAITINSNNLYEFHLIDIDAFLEDPDLEVFLDTKFSQTAAMSRPRGDYGTNGYVFYSCRASYMSVCRYNSNNDTTLQVVQELDGDVNKFRLSSDGTSYMVFDVIVEDGRDYFSFYNIDTGFINFGGFGTNPTPSPFDNLTLSHNATFGTTNQIAFYNVSNNAIINPKPLAISPTNPLIAARSSLSFQVTGGLPPYTFSVISGDGNINRDIGFYTAPADGLSNSTIQVIDAEGTKITTVASTPDAGLLDLAWGTNGIVDINISNFADAWAIKVLPSGKTLIAGSGAGPGSQDMAVMRLNFNGSLDFSFSNNGIKLIDAAGAADEVKAIDVDTQGRIILAGFCNVGGTNRACLSRLHKNGATDLSFGVNGVVVQVLGSGVSTYEDVVALPNGKILAAGSAIGASLQSFALSRYLPNGNLDPTFTAGGTVFTDFAGNNDIANSIAIQADGKIILAGKARVSGTDNFALARYNINGTLDLSFGTNGRVTTLVGNNFNEIREVIIEDNGKIFAVGTAKMGINAQDFAVARFLPNGALDLTFGPTGKNIIETNNTDSIAHSVFKQKDGNYIIAGSNDINASDFITIRIQQNGFGDPNFGPSGIKLTSINNHAEIHAIDFRPDGRIVTAGFGQIPPAGPSTHVYSTQIWP